MEIEIWGKDNCVFCIAAVELCKKKNLEYTYKTYKVDYTKEEILTEFVGATTFPQIKIDGNPIGGFQELENLI
jgi:glutaredoxin